jgi:hypothetical protein
MDLNLGPLNLSLPSEEDYRHEPLAPGFFYFENNEIALHVLMYFNNNVTDRSLVLHLDLFPSYL